jgi:hypothetical protein
MPMRHKLFRRAIVVTKNKTTMKVASTLVALTLSVTAVSAFGLHTGKTSAIKNVAPFAKKAMVQPVDIHGNRLANGVVSQEKTMRKM